MWPTILGGAVIGAIVNVAVYVAIKKIRREPLSWKGATAAVLAGAVGGAMIGAGAGILAGGGIRALGFMAANGAITSGGETFARNALEHKPLMENVAVDAAIGAAEAPVFFAAFRAVGRALPEVTGVLTGKESIRGAIPAVKDAARAVEVAAARRVAARLGRLAIPFLKTPITHGIGGNAIKIGTSSGEDEPPAATEADERAPTSGLVDALTAIGR